jgi:hypothetical protein
MVISHNPTQFSLPRSFTAIKIHSNTCPSARQAVVVVVVVAAVVVAVVVVTVVEVPRV